MDIDPQKIKWHYETLPRQTKKALDFLSKEEWLKQSSWYLAGGTALALQAGHRKSVDLDFFSEDKNFNEKKLLANFDRLPARVALTDLANNIQPYCLYLAEYFELGWFYRFGADRAEGKTILFSERF